MIRIYSATASEQAVLDVAVKGRTAPRKGRSRLTRMFARCFANPTKLILALLEIRAERTSIE